MKIKFKKTEDTVSLPRAAIEHEAELSELDMRIIFVIALRGEIDEGELDELAETFGVERSEIDISLSFMRGAGILASAGRKGRAVTPAKKTADTEKSHSSEKEKNVSKKLEDADKPPQYTSDEIDRIFSEHKELKSLLDHCQSTLGRVFNTVESNTVLVMRDYLRLAPEYILSLMAYCSEKGKTSLKYIEKMAFTLHGKGIDTPLALEEHLRRKEQFESREGELRSMFGMGARALTAKEHAAFSRWTIDWKLDSDLIRHAYELTVNAIREPSVPYADKILEKWHAAGYRTPDDVPAAEKTSGRGERQMGSFDTDEFFEAALRRSYTETMNGGGDDQL